MAKYDTVTMENVVGTKVLINLHRQAYEMLELQGLDSERFVARVTGVDSFGLWIENPNYCVVPVYDDEGTYIPPEDRKEICHRAVILLLWPYIQTIIQFPERKVFHPATNEEEIGFRAKVEEDQRG